MILEFAGENKGSLFPTEDVRHIKYRKEGDTWHADIHLRDGEIVAAIFSSEAVFKDFLQAYRTAERLNQKKSSYTLTAFVVGAEEKTVTFMRAHIESYFPGEKYFSVRTASGEDWQFVDLDGSKYTDFHTFMTS